MADIDPLCILFYKVDPLLIFSTCFFFYVVGKITPVFVSFYRSNPLFTLLHTLFWPVWERCKNCGKSKSGKLWCHVGQTLSYAGIYLPTYLPTYLSIYLSISLSLSFSLPLSVLSCPVMPCHVMSCHVMSCHVMSCPVLSFFCLSEITHVRYTHSDGQRVCYNYIIPSPIHPPLICSTPPCYGPFLMWFHPLHLLGKHPATDIAKRLHFEQVLSILWLYQVYELFGAARPPHSVLP